jgi:hypothetical protein
MLGFDPTPGHVVFVVDEVAVVRTFFPHIPYLFPFTVLSHASIRVLTVDFVEYLYEC